MTVLFPVLIRRVAVEAERRLREGASLLAAIAAIAGEPERTGSCSTTGTENGGRESAVPETNGNNDEGLRKLEDHEDRLRHLEQALEVHGRDLRTLRTDLDSLVTQLNERLLPRIDERMDDTERDLTALATGLIRTGRETAAQRSDLETVENRLADLRGRLARMEQRAGLWRDLQANIARIGDDIDELRTQFPTHPTPAPQPTAAQPFTETDPQTFATTDAQAFTDTEAQPYTGTDAQTFAEN